MEIEVQNIIRPLARMHEELTVALKTGGEYGNILSELSTELNALNLESRYTVRFRDTLLRDINSNSRDIQKLTASVRKTLSGNMIGNRKVNGIISKTVPHYRAYEQNLLPEITGIESEEGFRNIINEGNHTSPRVRNLYKSMAKWAKRNPGTIMKYILGIGLGSAFLSQLKIYQKLNTGCFVYYTDDLGNSQRQKIPTRSCLDDYVHNNPVNMPHPLDGISWTCDYDITHLIPHDNYNILQMGCKAICDPRNYNIFAKYTDYTPVDTKTLDDTKIYRCERGSFAQAVGNLSANIAKDIAKGIIGNTHWFNKAVRDIIIVVIVIVFCIFAYKIISSWKAS